MLLHMMLIQALYASGFEEEGLETLSKQETSGESLNCLKYNISAAIKMAGFIGMIS